MTAFTECHFQLNFGSGFESTTYYLNFQITFGWNMPKAELFFLCKSAMPHRICYFLLAISKQSRKVMDSFLNPHSHPSGCYRDAYAHGPSLVRANRRSPSYSLSASIGSIWVHSIALPFLIFTLSTLSYKSLSLGTTAWGYIKFITWLLWSVLLAFPFLNLNGRRSENSH